MDDGGGQGEEQGAPEAVIWRAEPHWLQLNVDEALVVALPHPSTPAHAAPLQRVASHVRLYELVLTQIDDAKRKVERAAAAAAAAAATAVTIVLQLRVHTAEHSALRKYHAVRGTILPRNARKDDSSDERVQEQRAETVR